MGCQVLENVLGVWGPLHNGLKCPANIKISLQDSGDVKKQGRPYLKYLAWRGRATIFCDFLLLVCGCWLMFIRGELWLGSGMLIIGVIFGALSLFVHHLAVSMDRDIEKTKEVKRLKNDEGS